MERYVGSPREAAAIRNTFAGLWSIDSSDPITQKLIQVCWLGVHLVSSRICLSILGIRLIDNRKMQTRKGNVTKSI